MSRDIESITNISSYATIDATGSWTCVPIQQSPDEIVIRQVSYNSIAATKAVLLVQMNNQVIGSVANILGFTSNPGTRIMVRSPLAQLSFSLLVPAPIPLAVGAAAVGDQIAIHMDFIKYRK